MKTLAKPTKTCRGFPIVSFKDHYGVSSSIQVSSSAGYDSLWLGVDDVRPQVLHGDAAKVGVKTDATCGWVDYPLPPEVFVGTRMLLDREQVEALVGHLTKWLKKGKL